MGGRREFSCVVRLIAGGIYCFSLLCCTVFRSANGFVDIEWLCIRARLFGKPNGILARVIEMRVFSLRPWSGARRSFYVCQL